MWLHVLNHWNDIFLVHVWTMYNFKSWKIFILEYDNWGKIPNAHDNYHAVVNNSRVGRKTPNKEIYPFKQNPLSLMTIITFFSTYGQPYFYQMFNEKLYLIKNVLMLRVRSMINLFLQIFNDFFNRQMGKQITHKICQVVE